MQTKQKHKVRQCVSIHKEVETNHNFTLSSVLGRNISPELIEDTYAYSNKESVQQNFSTPMHILHLHLCICYVFCYVNKEKRYTTPF